MIALASMKLDRFTVEMNILSLRIARRLSIGPYGPVSRTILQDGCGRRATSNSRAAPGAQPRRSEGRVCARRRGDRIRECDVCLGSLATAAAEICGVRVTLESCCGCRQAAWQLRDNNGLTPH